MGLQRMRRRRRSREDLEGKKRQKREKGKVVDGHESADFKLAFASFSHR